ncbi:MAG: hypothetical protein AB4042_04735 [Leptolyngbyaceae cyanobacterium]
MVQTLTKALMVSALSIPVGIAFSSAALASKNDEYGFSIVNNTGYTIEYLYMSESSMDTWTDALGDGVLGPYSEGVVGFANPSPQACLYDINAVFEDGSELDQRQINVCENDYYEFSEQ